MWEVWPTFDGRAPLVQVGCKVPFIFANLWLCRVAGRSHRRGRYVCVGPDRPEDDVRAVLSRFGQGRAKRRDAIACERDREATRAGRSAPVGDGFRRGGDRHAVVIGIVALRAIAPRDAHVVASFETFDVASDEESPEAITLRLSDADALKHCLKGLDETPRQAVLLAYVQGLSHGEIAARLAIPLGTIKSRIRRSLIALKECLG